MSDTTDLYTSSEYALASPTWHEEDSEWKAEQILRVYCPATTERPLHICDVGCGGGVLAHFDDLLGKQGIQTQMTGFDIAPLAIGRARQKWAHKPNIRFESRDVLDLESLDYDVVLLMDILEHLGDPKGFLVGLRKRGARQFVMHLPLESYWLAILRGKTDPVSSPVGHVSFYDTHSALGLLGRGGLTVRKWVYTPELDLDIRLHRTFKSMLAYLPRKILTRLFPSATAHTIGGLALMAHCTAEGKLA